MRPVYTAIFISVQHSTDIRITAFYFSIDQGIIAECWQAGQIPVSAEVGVFLIFPCAMFQTGQPRNYIWIGTVDIIFMRDAWYDSVCHDFKPATIVAHPGSLQD